MTELSLSSASPVRAGLLSSQCWGEVGVFAEVARAGSMRAAAEKLGLSQPTIARMVRRLQDIIGTQLFLASKSGVRLTPHGEELAAAIGGLGLAADLPGQDWAELRIFAEVARVRSMNRAAQRLGLTHTKVARRVRRLQELMATQLVTISRHGVELTPQGAELAATLVAFDQTIYSITSDLKARDRDVEGIVRINITDGMAAFFAAPAVPAFSAAHPRIQLHMRSATAFTDLRENQTDMMLTMMPIERPDIVCRRLGILHFVPMATHSYVARHGLPTRDNLADHWFLQSHLYQSDIPVWRDWQAACAKGRVSHFCDNPFAYGMMVKQGMGIGLLGSYLTGERSSVPLDIGIHAPVPMYAIALAERLTARPVALVFDWLCRTFDDTNPWFGPHLDFAELGMPFPAVELMLEG